MLEQLFELFRAQKTSLAIVVDEFGGTAGVVALEDAIEEIIGDIVAQDEVTPMAPQTIDEKTSRVDGKMSARAFCAHFGLSIQLTRASTVGGIALEVLGNLPKVGQEFAFSSLDIHVEALERGRARTLIVRRTSRPVDDQEEDQSQ
jgi:CBS domain containing-hemolysin-like protein